MSKTFDKVRNKILYYISSKYYGPKYKITLTQKDDSKTWEVHGEVYDLNEDEAKLVELVTRNTEQEKREYEARKNSDRKMYKIVGLSSLGLIAGMGLLIYGLTNIKGKDKTDDESTSKEITMYGVSIDTDIFEEMYNIDKWDHSINIATLRGVESLHDSEYEKIQDDMKNLKQSINSLKNGSDIDLNEFLKQTQEINGYSKVAMDDIKRVSDLPGEVNNLRILSSNYEVVSDIYYDTKSLTYDIDNMKWVKSDYQDAKYYDLSGTKVYGVHYDNFKVFSTLEEAQEYYDNYLKEFEDSIIRLNGDVNGKYGYGPKGHNFEYDSVITEFKTIGTDEEKEKYVNEDKVPNDSNETEITSTHNANYGM